MLESDGQQTSRTLGYGLKFDRGRFMLNDYEIAQRVRPLYLSTDYIWFDLSLQLPRLPQGAGIF
jgi:hypothetical protein